MMKKEYTKTGKCIWCGKSYPDVTFLKQPHIVPRNMGGSCIGFDICDECNDYFGTPTKAMLSTNLVFKEAFNTIRFFSKTLTPHSYKNFHSAYFKYNYSKNTLKLKHWLSIDVFTKQFKRSLYEVFLQKYHSITENGHNSKFNYVRSYARYANIVQDLKVYYAYNRIILAPEEGYADLPMTDTLIDEIDKYGFFHFWFKGHNFFMEIEPEKCKFTRNVHLQGKANETLIPVEKDGPEKIYEITNIFQIDFLMNRFVKTNFDSNYNIRR